jgi:hypothetical protein
MTMPLANTARNLDATGGDADGGSDAGPDF